MAALLLSLRTPQAYPSPGAGALSDCTLICVSPRLSDFGVGIGKLEAAMSPGSETVLRVQHVRGAAQAAPRSRP